MFSPHYKASNVGTTTNITINIAPDKHGFKKPSIKNVIQT